MANKKVALTLDWKGPYEKEDDVPMEAGIYMVLAGKKDQDGSFDTSTYRILDIGQSGRTGKRLADHDRAGCWNSHSKPGETILFKYALMPTANYTEDDRRAVECCLRAHNGPLPCGTECNTGYARTETVTIANTGKHSPLKADYACGPAER